MLLKSLIELLCRSIVSDDDLGRIKKAGKEDGKKAVAARLQGFSEGAAEAIAECAAGLLSYDGDAIDAEFTVRPKPEDFEEFDRPGLMAECRRHDIEYDRHDTKATLIGYLCGGVA